MHKDTRRISIRFDEDWKTFALIGVLFLVEIGVGVQTLARWDEMNSANRWGSIAGALLVFPGMIVFFAYAWLRIARVRPCSECGGRMQRQARPVNGPYLHECEACGHIQSTGVYPHGGPGRRALGHRLLGKNDSNE